MLFWQEISAEKLNNKQRDFLKKCFSYIVIAGDIYVINVVQRQKKILAIQHFEKHSAYLGCSQALRILILGIHLLKSRSVLALAYHKGISLVQFQACFVTGLQT